MALLSSETVLRLVDSVAILLGQAYQLARARLASAGSAILRLRVQRDQEATEVDLLRREAEIFRGQREGLQVAGPLEHLLFARVSVDPDDLDLPRRLVDGKQDQVAGQALHA